MKIIEKFQSHPKYEAALAIFRSKIIGDASNVLTNEKTAYNIRAIIKTLDSTYADQRPLYVVEAEMTSIKQFGKTLKEFYDAINQALNIVISKIAFTYREDCEQRSLVAEAQQKAVRAFIVGLRSQVIRNILYGRTPGSLAQAFRIAQTVYYDTGYLQLEQNHESQKHQQPKYKNINNIQAKDKQEPKIGLMEANNQNRFKQGNWLKPNLQPNAVKGDNNPTRQDYQKFQRINQLQDDGDGEPNEECIPDDLISNSSLHTSAFLDE